jgi:hypothetical protein
MNKAFIIACRDGYLSDLGWTQYIACASWFNEVEANRILAVLPGTWRLEDVPFYLPEPMSMRPDFCRNLVAA